MRQITDPTITRSDGLPTGHMGLMAGGGHTGATPDLDQAVARAAELLREAYGRDVVIRFNSDRRSGGAWIVTHPQDSFTGNAELGICAALMPSKADRERIREQFPVYAANAREAREWREAWDALPKQVELSAHVGTASLTRRDDPDLPEGQDYLHTEVESVHLALVYLHVHATLREAYP